MTKVAIVGATGPTGIHLVAEVRKTAAAVRVVARGMDKLARLFPDAAVEKRWQVCEPGRRCLVDLVGNSRRDRPIYCRNIHLSRRYDCRGGVLQRSLDHPRLHRFSCPISLSAVRSRPSD